MAIELPWFITDKKDTLEEVLKCGICKGRFRQPRILQCGHTFCLPCLRNFSYSSTCALCRAPLSSFPRNGAEGLPVNFIVLNMLDARTQEIGFVEARCQVCKKNNIQGECHHCNDKILCATCLVEHTRILNTEFQQEVQEASHLMNDMSAEVSVGNKHQTATERNAEGVKRDIKKWSNDCGRKIKAKEAELIREVTSFVKDEIEPYKTFKSRSDSLQSYSEIARAKAEEVAKINRNASSIQKLQDELIRSTADCKELSANGPDIVRDIRRRAKKSIEFCSPDADSISRSVSEFQGIRITKKHREIE